MQHHASGCRCILPHIIQFLPILPGSNFWHGLCKKDFSNGGQGYLCFKKKIPNCRLRHRVIGVIRTPFTEPAGTPIQTVYGENIEGQVLLFEPYAAALDDIEGFDRLWLIYWMDRVNEFKPRIIPYRDDREHGVFATRSPSRPNPIGMSVVRLLRGRGQHPSHR